jgi:uncharacterized protein YbcC (UPF0753/DUF2309 family)
MPNSKHAFYWHETHHHLKHYLPSQRPLKDFIHHNTLHGLQHLTFHTALQQARETFGYQVYLTLNDFRKRYRAGEISEQAVQRTLRMHVAENEAATWHQKLTVEKYNAPVGQRIGQLRSQWKDILHLNLDKEVHPLFFRLIAAYLDQGISIWKFPITEKGFLNSLIELEKSSFFSLFKTTRARAILLQGELSVPKLLEQIVGDERLFEQYLFDQQFVHPGWSGMIATLEDYHESLLDTRKITLHDAIVLELLLELDVLENKLGPGWKPLAALNLKKPEALFTEVPETEYYQVMRLWQEALEWSYYDQVISGLQHASPTTKQPKANSMQAFFCIDDRECSFRRYVELADPACKTFGTAGYFNIDAYFQPEHSKFHTKICPAPVDAKYLIRERESKIKHETDSQYDTKAHGLLGGWFISQSVGFLSAFKLMTSVWRPSATVGMVSSAQHMDPEGELLFERGESAKLIGHLLPGYTVAEMTDRVENLLRSCGLTQNFSHLVYMIGHGASSMNNTHYAGYDCGACSGRPGSVNARVFAKFANHNGVRAALQNRGITIPENCRFVAALQDTTRDDITFFDLEGLSAEQKIQHQKHVQTFNEALHHNAAERARRFNMDFERKPEDKIHEEIKLRAVELFEPRPELNHATNALLLVGRRAFSKHLFLDRRAFLNSYNPTTDADGQQLADILNAITPVCGGINLEYYFSRTDNYRLGAGTKLPHNVMGLFGVANGLEGDLRTGLPSQMIEVHDPIRLLIAIEQTPEIVLAAITTSERLYEWFKNEWVRLVAIDPSTKAAWLFAEQQFVPYAPFTAAPPVVGDVLALIKSSTGNIPVHQF